MKFFYAAYRQLLFASFLLFGFLTAWAQNVSVTGQVKDITGAPLQGASVQIRGGNGTTTDANGRYSVTAAPGKQTLIVSFVGYATQETEITVGPTGWTQDIALVNSGDLGTVTVVGSRNVSRTRVETPVPVDVIPVSQIINDVGQVDLNQILTFIAPSFQSSRQTISDGTDHVDPAQLRGLGTDQVLVLVNGKRRHQSALVNVNGTVNRGQVGTDMSAIPATSIERIEILRDGAAAQYGSDAIAGVINIVLKKRTGLLEAGLSFGQHRSKYPKNYALYKITNKTDDPDVSVSDGETIQGSLGYGFGIGKGYLSLTGEYINRNATNRTGTYTGTLYPNVNGVNRDDSILNAKGLTRNDFDMRVGNSDMKGGAIFYNFGIPLSTNGELYSFGGYSKKQGEATGIFRYPTSYFSATTAGRFANNVLNLYPNGFLPEIHSDIIDFSAALGFRTKFNEWNFDISNTFGSNVFDFGVENSVNYTQFATGATTPQTVFDAGGLKFFQNTANADISRKYDVLAGLNIAAGLEYRVDGFDIKSGELASYENFEKVNNANNTLTPGAQVFAGFVNTIGGEQTRNAKAVYIDVEQDFSNKFLLTGALRFENYSDFGSTFNYKFSSRYKFSDQLNLRASISTGFRAPSMQQQFYTKTNTVFVGSPLVPVQAGTFTNNSVPAQLLGIPTLKEETSQNYSVGLTAKPFTGFEVTVDAYQIDIDDRIVLTNNFNGGGNAQLQQQLNAAGANTANFFTNAIDTRARGLEAVLSYNRSLFNNHSLRTTLAMTFIDNEVKKDDNGKPIIYASPVLLGTGQIGNYFNREDQSRIEVANPKNKITLTFNYKVSKLSAMLRFVRFGQVEYLDPTINPANPGAFPMNAFNNNNRETLDQVFDPKVVTDLSVSYQILPALNFTLGANNLFDVYQDIHTHSGNMNSGRFIYSRRVQQMGFNGAYFFARLKLALPVL